MQKYQINLPAQENLMEMLCSLKHVLRNAIINADGINNFL